MVLLCTTPNIHPLAYALGRFWDSTIGLLVGMVINTLVFPYDNSFRIRSATAALEKELLAFLEELFDGDTILPDANRISRTIKDLENQLQIYTNQKLILHLRRQKKELEQFRSYARSARELAAHMEVLCRMDPPGRLSEENRAGLTACGARIADTRVLDSVMERDVVTNYHVRRLLALRRELLASLRRKTP